MPVQWFLAALVVAPVVYLVVGAVRGRVQVRACCPDPAHDKRLAGAFETGKDRFEGRRVMAAPEIDDANGDEDLSMDDALGGKVLHHAPGGKLVVVRVDQEARDGFE